MSDPIEGIHHITAVCGDPVRNLRFYRDVLGLRFIKKTVNFDDPFTYHLYYGDAAGTPGSALTFFPWQGLRRGRPGSGMVEEISFSVPPGSLGWWRGRLSGKSVEVKPLTLMDEPGLRFADPDGLQLALVERAGHPAFKPWTADVPPECALRGFHGATERLNEVEATDRFLRGVLDFTLVAEEGDRRRYAASGGGPGVYDIVVDAGAPEAVSGNGTVHHIAFATHEIAASERWRATLLERGVNVSPVIDRKYFHSIYFREPGGVLFEFATLGPGFAVDEPVETLGTALKLPEMHEPLRARIEETLPRLDT